MAELLALPEAKEPDEDLVLKAVRHWLATHDGWLLVFDNADRPDELKPFLPADLRGRFLLTSRAATGFAKVGIKKPFRLPVLPPEDAEALLLGRVDREDTAADEERAAVAELAYLALALEQAAAYVESRQISYVRYLERYREEHLALVEKAGPETGDYPKTVATTWTLNFQEVEQASPASADMLRGLSLLREGVPLEIFEQGEPLYQRALDIREKALGGDHPDVGQSLNNLAALYHEQGRYEEAEPLYQRALDILEKALGGDHPNVGNSLHNLAGLYHAQGRYEEAEPLYQRALDNHEKALGPDHPSTVLVRRNYAIFLRETGRAPEADALESSVRKPTG